MALDLILAADAAYPFDYTLLPRACRIVLGYVGEPNETPHIWTAAEVAAVHDAGLVWAPIHTVPPGPFAPPAGTRAGQLMAEELKRYDYPADGPVFLDVEHDSYAANPAQANLAVAEWQHVMHGSGRRHAHPYLPLAAGYGWQANWTHVRPTDLGQHVVGVQYDNALHGDAYDLSVFRREVFASLLKGKQPMAKGLSHADREWIVQQITTARDDVVKLLHGLATDDDDKHPRPFALKHLHQQLTELAKVTGTGGSGAVDVAQLAKALADQLGPQMGGDVASELARRLGRG